MSAKRENATSLGVSKETHAEVTAVLERWKASGLGAMLPANYSLIVRAGARALNQAIDWAALEGELTLALTGEALQRRVEAAGAVIALPAVEVK